VGRAQMLYIGKQGAVTYAAAGNAEIGAGSRGTVALWYHPSAKQQSCNIVQMMVDEENALTLDRKQDRWRWYSSSEGSARTLDYSSDTVAWRFVVATWDFSGGPGAGVLRLYLDGEEVPGSPVTDASAPVGPPDLIRLGPGADHAGTLAYAVLDQMAIWDDTMSGQQVGELYDRGRKHVPQPGDCSGELLFRACWDEQYDADAAEGSGTASFEGEPDQYCLLDCGSQHDGRRFSYRVGMPAHDGSPEDRVPLMALLQRTKSGSVEETNTEEYGRLDIDASDASVPIGACLAPWLPGPAKPMTLRLGLHIEEQTAPLDLPVAVGAHSYIVGDEQRFECGAGCTVDTLYSDSLSQEDGHWAGAELHLLTGAAANEKVRVLASSQSSKSLTIDGELSDAPAQGDVAIVIKPRRVEPFQDDGHLYRLECDLSEEHVGVERFAILETAICGDRGYTCVNLGRLQQYPEEITGEDVFFGKREKDVYPQWTCAVLIDRIEMDGPGTYTATTHSDDAFLVIDPESGETTKAWRIENLTRETRAPEQYGDPAAVQASFTAAGTWRDTILYPPIWMEYDAENERVVALLVGKDPDEVARVGYIHGTWNEGTGRMQWEDDPDPRNPLFELEELESVLEGRSQPFGTLARVNGVHQVAEDDWVLSFTATIGNPDGVAACALVGAPDKYSFDPSEHFDPSLNPLTPPLAGDDKVVPEGSGIGLWGNRDCDPRFVRNPWAKDAGARFWGCARAKTVNNAGTELWLEHPRPLCTLVTGDFRNMRTLPWRNQIVGPAYGWFHWPHPVLFGPSTMGLVVDDGGVTKSHVNLYASEDGVHMSKPLDQALIPRLTPPLNAEYMMAIATPVRIGDRRVYWYQGGKSGNDFNMAWIRLDGEALYRLESSATQGEMETCELRRSAPIWDELRLNVDPKDGSVKVAVLDAETGEPLPGFSYDDCGTIAEGVERRVSWQGVGLGEVTAEGIRLRFRLTRPGTGDASPELYSWAIAPPQASDRPQVRSVQVEGKTNPARVADPQPELWWEYTDRLDRKQSAYHVLVASSEEKLDENQGDLWDSGIVLSDTCQVRYAGAELGSEQTYFWKVRVRNSEGVWSEEW